MILETLDGLDDVWQWTVTVLERATVDRRSPLRWPVVSTVNKTGVPMARTVGLRAFDASAMTMTFYTDRRTPKVEELAANSALAFTFHDSRNGVQFRANGRARIVVSGPDWEQAWEALSDQSRLDYQSIETPGNKTTNPIKDFNPRMGSANFAIVNVVLSRLEWLHLQENKHRRAVFSRTQETWDRYWIIP